MADLITPDRILLPLRARNGDQAVEKLARLAADQAGLDQRFVRERLLEREDLTTFGIGRGIALPHAIIPNLAKPLGIFGRLKPPVDFMAADGRLADLIFLLLVPGRHILLPALSCVARRLHDEAAVGRLRLEDSRERIHLILTADF